MDMKVTLSAKDEAGFTVTKSYDLAEFDDVKDVVKDYELMYKLNNKSAHAKRYREAIDLLEADSGVRNTYYSDGTMSCIGGRINLYRFDEFSDGTDLASFLDSDHGFVVIEIEHNETFEGKPMDDETYADVLLDANDLNWFRKYVIFVVNGRLVLRKVDLVEE
jgi:hypothetical protein